VRVGVEQSVDQKLVAVNAHQSIDDPGRVGRNRGPQVLDVAVVAGAVVVPVLSSSNHPNDGRHERVVRHDR